MVSRYDRVETQYLTSGDFAAQKQLHTDYARQTQLLVEDVLRLGKVTDEDIWARFYGYYRDSTLQQLLCDVEERFSDLHDIEEQLTEAFHELKKLMPETESPEVYAFVGSLNESILIHEQMLGISLDKYMGTDYPLYGTYGYSSRQRVTMTRQFIVPDCLIFYIVSRYPPTPQQLSDAALRKDHIGRVRHIVNKALKKQFFKGEEVDRASRYMLRHPDVSADELMQLPQIN